MIRLKRLRQAADKQAFVERYRACSGFAFRYPESEAQLRWWELYLGGRLAGGWIHNFAPPYRSLGNVGPEADRRRLEAELNPRQLVEIQALHTLPYLRKRSRGGLFWVVWGLHTIAQRGEGFLFAALTPQLARRYSQDPRVELLYHGPSIYPAPYHQIWLYLRPPGFGLQDFTRFLKGRRQR